MIKQKLAVMTIDGYVHLAKAGEVIHSHIAERVNAEYKSILGSDNNYLSDFYIASTGYAIKEGYTDTLYTDKYGFEYIRGEKV